MTSTDYHLVITDIYWNENKQTNKESSYYKERKKIIVEMEIKNNISPLFHRCIFESRFFKISWKIFKNLGHSHLKKILSFLIKWLYLVS